MTADQPDGPPGWVSTARSSKLLQGSAWILVGLGIQSILGFSFWFLGSRVASSAELGRASALFTAIQFVNYASGLGLTISLARHATDTSAESDSLFTWGVVATVASSIIGGVACLAVAHTSAIELVKGSPTGWAIFCAYTAGTSVGLLVDVRLMAARRWDWLVGRIVVTGLLRLPFVLLRPHVSPDVWLYHLMLAPLAIGGVLAVPLLRPIGAGGTRWQRPKEMGAVARYSAVNWVATLASQAPQFLLPLVVSWSVASAVYANFFLAWTVTGLVVLVPGAIAQVLLVEGAKDEAAAERAAANPNEPHEPAAGKAREALAFSLGLATLAWVVALVGGSLVTSTFGHAYRGTARLLPSLVFAGIPWAISSVRLSEARIRRDQVATVAITATLGLGILVPTLLFVPHSGTIAATRSWIGGNVAAALVAVAVHQRSRRVPRLAAASS